MLLLGLAGWLLRPMWRPSAAGRASRPAHLGVLAEQLAALDRDVAAGRLSPEHHHAARLEVQRRVLDESIDDSGQGVQGDDGSRRAAWAVTLAVPLAALVLYAGIGNRAALDAGSATTLANGATAAALASPSEPTPEVTPEAMEALLANLAKRLESPSADPATDAKGWTMLARSYAALRRFPEADRAYARAIALAPADAGLYADRADVLAMLQGERLAGEPERLVERSLQLDPKNLKALALAGAAAFERRDWATAQRRWQAARAFAPAGSEFAAGLDRSLAEVAQATGDGATSPGGPTTPGSAAAPSGATTAGAALTAGGATTATGPAAAGASPESVSGRVEPASTGVHGRVDLAPALAGRAAPTDTVFIVARAAEGPRMPLAVVRRSVAELPFDFTLDDRLAMQPALKLSAFDRVVVSARVSRSGTAEVQPGDLYGESGPVSNRTVALSLSIDKVRR